MHGASSATESGEALGRAMKPEEISLTYWFFTDPPVETVLRYGRSQHAENWSFLLVAVQEIERRMEDQGIWPLTDDLDACGRCAYRIPCGRVDAEQANQLPDLSDWEVEEEDASIFPEIP